MNIFEFFFKYRPIVYEKGRLTFGMLSSKWMFLLFILVAIGGAIYFYRKVSREKFSPWMIVLRAATFVILLFMLMQPVLNVAQVLPQDSYIAVVIDSSESMQIKDDGITARKDALLKKMEETSFLAELAKRFKVRLVTFNSEARRIDGIEDIRFDGKRTRLEAPVNLLQQELGTLPVTGVVLMSDGADNASEAFAEALARLQKRKIPFYAVGVGAENITKDAEIVKVSSPREMLKDSTAVVTLSVKSAGLSGRQAEIDVRENGQFLLKHDLTLPKDGEIVEVPIDIPVKNAGNSIFQFTVRAADDRIAQNNTLDSLITIRDDHPKILYLEGEPRWQYKFGGRAIEDDPNLQVERMLRTSQNKFYYQVSKQGVLAEGFPKTPEELFEYSGIVFGSIEAAFFSQPEQRKMIVDFVNQRGGGFLMVGGKNSFSSGLWQNTEIASILPVELLSEKALPVLDEVLFVPTEYGETHNMMRLASDPKKNRDIWDKLPALPDYNRVGEVKPGGVVLARGNPDKTSGNPILLAYQRYGRGRAMVFTSGGSWHWQMLMHSEDQTYELFWKQMLRWLVTASPAQVSVTSDKDTYPPGELVSLSAEVMNKKFEGQNNARVTLRVNGPDLQSDSLPMDWSGTQDGTYQTQLNAATKEGTYQIQVDAMQGAETLGTYKAAFQVKDRPVEFYDAALNAGSLRSIAEQTSGRYYTLDQIAEIPEDAIYVDSPSSFMEQKELWDVPILFMLLSAFLGGEWLWRKKKGLA